MSEHFIGYLIIGLSVLSVGGILIFSRWQWRRRWDVSSYGGHLVRFDYGARDSTNISRELHAVGPILDKAIAELIPEYVGNPWRVEVVPPGEIRTPTVPFGLLPDNSIVGGSIRSERWLPFTPKFWVAVVVDERTGFFVAHEVARHILAILKYGDRDPDHKRLDLAALESEVKKKLRERT